MSLSFDEIIKRSLLSLDYNPSAGFHGFILVAFKRFGLIRQKFLNGFEQSSKRMSIVYPYFFPRGDMSGVRLSKITHKTFNKWWRKINKSANKLM